MKKHILKLTYLLFVVVLLVSLVGCGEEATNNVNTEAKNETSKTEDVTPATLDEGYTLYTSADGKLSFGYSNEWTTQDGTDGIDAFFIAPDQMTTVNLVSETLPTDYTASEYAVAAKTQLTAELGEIDIDSEGAVQIGNIQGYQLTYSLEMDGLNIKLYQAFFIKDKQASVFTYSSLGSNFDTYKGVVDKMIESVRVK